MQYGFRAVAISQFRDRTFACPGVTGAARNQVRSFQVGLLVLVILMLWGV